MIYAISILIVVCAAQGWLLYRLERSMRTFQRFDERLSRCTQGLSLLADTSEAGFAMLGNELGKLSSGSARRPSSKITTRRVVTAAARGRDVAEIAAHQGLSEGEVRLRMHLATADSAGTNGDAGGAVRP